uniref:Uncharacterized protein n=2 Tax=Tetraselmis sp. GSL018 TaxID=582737 RepID=A0A061QZB3_9CHLO|mmetsp:Transcript_33145/g.78614  ORF Transcript_33145/g.78614 Transcript_33145/m.78614 type:complete len:522 (+) Transcript_33145:149-1714(+)
MKRTRGYSRWSEEEEAALRIGVARYGEGKWKRILCDAALSRVFVERSNVDLKDKWRTMQCAEKGKHLRPTHEDAQHTRDCELSAKLSEPVLEQGGRIYSMNHTTFQRRARPRDVSNGPQERPKPSGQVRAAAAMTGIHSGSLASALAAAQRRHNGTTGERAQQQLVREMLSEVCRSLELSPSASALFPPRAEAPNLSLWERVSEPGSVPTAAQLFSRLMSLAAERRRSLGEQEGAALQKLAEFELLVKRQFGVLRQAGGLLLEDIESVLEVDTAAAARPTEDVAQLKGRTSEQGGMAGADPEPKAGEGGPEHGLPGGPCEDDDGEEELLVAGALKMICEATPSAGTSRAQSSANGELQETSGGEPEASSRCLSNGSLDRREASPKGVLHTPAVEVPEGCGLVSESVSAALSKATRLLSHPQRDLLPVKGLLQGCSSYWRKPSEASVADSSLGQLSLSNLLLLPSQAAHPLVSPLAPLSAAEAARPLPVGLQLPVLSFPPAAEQWYPAYMAYLYSGMVNSMT